MTRRDSHPSKDHWPQSMTKRRVERNRSSNLSHLSESLILFRPNEVPGIEVLGAISFFYNSTYIQLVSQSAPAPEGCCSMALGGRNPLQLRASSSGYPLLVMETFAPQTCSRGVVAGLWRLRERSRVASRWSRVQYSGREGRTYQC